MKQMASFLFKIQIKILNNYSGGFDGSTGLNSAEVFDGIKNEWTLISSMSTRRSSVGVGVVNRKVYAVGGKFLPRRDKEIAVLGL